MESVYVHIPFCVQKCRYCDFTSFPLRQKGNQIKEYAAALLEEARICSEKYAHLIRPLISLYIGGGTPTVLPQKELCRIIAGVRRQFYLEEGAELTVEANPGTVDSAYLKSLREIGVNRLSIGAQSFDDSSLRAMGRIHDAAGIRQAVADARSSGITNINLDLIYGLPDQSMEKWQATLAAAVSLDVPHISAYGLKVEADTPWGRAQMKGELAVPDQDVSRDLLEAAIDFLQAKGYVHYEISNFARPGFSSRHNKAYWQNEDYLGLGVAAASHIGSCRWTNTRVLDDYLAALSRGECPPGEEEDLDDKTALAESIFLGLRLLAGIDLDAFQQRFGVNIMDAYAVEIARLKNQGLVETVSGHLRLTREGLFLGNEVFMEFLP